MEQMLYEQGENIFTNFSKRSFFYFPSMWRPLSNTVLFPMQMHF